MTYVHMIGLKVRDLGADLGALKGCVTFNKVLDMANSMWYTPVPSAQMPSVKGSRRGMCDDSKG
jgi:hypothetical protein